MSPDLSRYVPGGDVYDAINLAYGIPAADRVQAAAETGDYRNISETLGEIRNGPPLDQSTADAFWNQITTDPLAAPLDYFGAPVSKGIQDATSTIVKVALLALAAYVVVNILKD
jgi:hypothetical protein